MNQDIRWVQRLVNLKKAFAQLADAVSLPAYSKLEQQGLIKCFEFTYELAWNTLKDLLEDQGHTNILGSKDTFRISNRVGLITDGSTWMEMVSSRNATSHTYNEATADDIAKAILDEYFPEFEKLIATLEGIRSGRYGTQSELFENN
jgi:nucleotidyltransferase substrate binding protein (TIGR01987 family)